MRLLALLFHFIYENIANSAFVSPHALGRVTFQKNVIFTLVDINWVTILWGAHLILHLVLRFLQHPSRNLVLHDLVSESWMLLLHAQTERF